VAHSKCRCDVQVLVPPARRVRIAASLMQTQHLARRADYAKILISNNVMMRKELVARAARQHAHQRQD
jgi:hypothetical protein